MPYLDALGISDLYASSYLTARPGSLHGYDIVDHAALNPEIGSPEDYDRMVAALAERGMGQILDVVPNHMGIAAGANRGGTTCWKTAAALRTPSSSTSTGRPPSPISPTRCSCPSSATSTDACSRTES